MAGRRQQFPGASQFLPANAYDIEALAAASRSCQGCDLYREATQTVFGEGATHPALVLVGEAPGDHEDLEGSPFVGPAGAVLRRALAQAGIEESSVYFTNAVKHFKFERRSEGKPRLHKKPSSAEAVACRPWLLAELEATQPSSVVALGATAAHSLLGTSFRLTAERGEMRRVEGLPPIIATYHPSAILRSPDTTAREQLRTVLIADLAFAAGLYAKS